jgi:oligopeptide transport system permease protein
MLRYVVKRLVYMFVTLFVIVSLTWLMSQLLPGTPFADEKLSEETRAQLFAKYGLDEPLLVQYGKYMLNVARGDLGNSYYFRGRPVTQIIMERLPVSAFLGAQAVLIGLVMGLVLGITAALRHNSIWDSAATTLAVLGVSVPSFVLGPILQYWLGWFPIAFFESWWHSVLPSLALSVFVTATVARFVRAEMLEILGQDYTTLARAKGLSGLAVVFKHVLRNALIPLVTVLAPLTIYIMTGSLVVEQIFAVPGIGEQFVRAVVVNDHVMVIGTALFFSVMFILALLIQDILYGLIDPRIRVSGAKD